MGCRLMAARQTFQLNEETTAFELRVAMLIYLLPYLLPIHSYFPHRYSRIWSITLDRWLASL